MPGLKERAKTLVELLDGAGFLFAARPLAMDEKAADILAKGGRAHLAALLPKLARSLRNGQARRWRRWCAPMPRRTGAKLGAVAQPLRAALTGRSTSPGIFDVLTVLGREESLARIEDQARP